MCQVMFNLLLKKIFHWLILEKERKSSIARWASTSWLQKSPVIGYSLQVSAVLSASLRPFHVLLSGNPCGPVTLSDPLYSLICKLMFFLFKELLSLSLFFTPQVGSNIQVIGPSQQSPLSNPEWLCETFVCPKFPPLQPWHLSRMAPPAQAETRHYFCLPSRLRLPHQEPQ